MDAESKPLSLEPAKLPTGAMLAGPRVTLVRIDPEAHAMPLYEAIKGHDALWQYLFEAPPEDAKAFKLLVAKRAAMKDPFFYAILDNKTSSPVGMASYLRIEPGHRVIEVGSILFSPSLQKTPAATEAMYLMAKHVFEDLGYRRYEWKCNALNGPSRSAALRLGFSFEGIFRQHMIIKGESRDTAWFAMLDAEWPARRQEFEQWLAPENFHPDGTQKRSLASFRES